MASTTPTAGRPSASTTGSAAPSACAARAFDSMSLEERAGQLILLGTEFDRLSSAEKNAIVGYHLGSIWLEHKRTNGVGGIAALTAEVQALAGQSNASGVGFFIAADQEGGRIQRLNGTGFSTMPTALVQGSLAPDILETDAAAWGRELAAAGISVDFAPVMDVVPAGMEKTNKPIGVYEREFGHDPATVGVHGAAVVRGLRTAGVAATLKHFPGLGRVSGNTDKSGGVVDAVTGPQDPYLATFQAGIDAGADFVMISLASYPLIDPGNLAVFSSEVMRLLRDQLGFRGLIVSDDLGAAAAVADVAVGQRAVMFVRAGGEMVVVAGTSQAGAMAQALVAAALADTGFRVQLDAAALHVLQTKAAYGLLNCAG